MGWHFENAAFEIEGLEDRGLEGDHFIEDGVGGGGSGGCPGEHFNFGEFVDAVEAFCVDASGAGFSSVAARVSAHFEGKLGGGER